MKTIPLRLVLDVKFDPQGLSAAELKQNLNQVVRDAVNNGTLTGDSPATVEHYSYKVISPRRKKKVKTCPHCGCKRAKDGSCQDPGCPAKHEHDECKKCSSPLKSLYKPKKSRS